MIKTIAAALVAVGLLAVTPTVAAADVPRVRAVNEGGDHQQCVTSDEFDTWAIGMRRGRVERILDTKGHKVSKRALDGLIAQYGGQDYGSQVQVRSYPVCAQSEPFVEDGKTYIHRITGGEVLIMYGTARRGRALFGYYDADDMLTAAKH